MVARPTTILILCYFDITKYDTECVSLVTKGMIICMSIYIYTHVCIRIVRKDERTDMWIQYTPTHLTATTPTNNFVGQETNHNIIRFSVNWLE